MSILIITLDGNKMLTTRSFYNRISKSLFFPEYFGQNLDALFDCLTDLSGILSNHTEVLINIKNEAGFLSKEKPEKREAVLQIFEDAAMPENRYDDRVFQVRFLD